jgi:hypothetical protein
MKHTPWRIEADLDGEVPSIYIVGSNGELIAEIGGARTYGMENARAIVAVSEMMEALIEIKKGVLPYKDESGVIRIMLGNYAKANIARIIERATGKKIEEVVG